MYRCTRCSWFGNKEHTVQVSPASSIACKKCGGECMYIPIESDDNVRERGGELDE